MKAKVLLGLLFTAFLGLGACANKQHYTQSYFNGAKRNSLEGQVVWLKNKRDTIDIKLALTNHYKHPIHFRPSSPKINFSGRKGIIDKEFPLTLDPGESRSFVLIWDFEPEIPPTGIAAISMTPVYKGYEDAKKKEKLPSLNMKVQVN